MRGRARAGSCGGRRSADRRQSAGGGFLTSSQRTLPACSPSSTSVRCLHPPRAAARGRSASGATRLARTRPWFARDGHDGNAVCARRRRRARDSWPDPRDAVELRGDQPIGAMPPASHVAGTGRNAGRRARVVAVATTASAAQAVPPTTASTTANWRVAASCLVTRCAMHRAANRRDDCVDSGAAGA